MYLPRSLLPHLYTQLLSTTHPLSPPTLILTALTVDALAATRVLTSLLKRDYIPHKIQPVAGYADLQKAGEELVRPLMRSRGGEGGTVVCLGVGGMVGVAEVLGLEPEEGEEIGAEGHGVEVWVLDARRPWNLENVFSGLSSLQVGEPRRGVEADGKVLASYRPGKGGVIVWDDGDVETGLKEEREAYLALLTMPEITEEDVAEIDDGGGDSDEEDEKGEDDAEPGSSQSRKRKASSQDSDDDDLESASEQRPRQRRRSNNSTPIPSSPPSNQLAPFTSSPPPAKPPSQRQLRRQLLTLRRKHEATLEAYYARGASVAEPLSSLLYSLASDLGREDNDALWLAIVGIESVDASPHAAGSRHSSHGEGRRTLDRIEQIKAVLRDEVRRLNPTSASDLLRSQGGESGDIIPTHARSPTDTSIRLSPEPHFLLIRHWSLYDSMLHSPLLSTRLHIWHESGRKRLHKLLAKMGISLMEAGKGYTHMDVTIKRELRARILRFAAQYGLEGLVPRDEEKGGWGFVRSWGWKATLSAVDVATVVSAILEVGGEGHHMQAEKTFDPHQRLVTRQQQAARYSERVRALPSPPHSSDDGAAEGGSSADPDYTSHRFYLAYDALAPATGISSLLSHIPVAQHLARAILRTGSALISKKQIRHLRAFRMGVVKEGPDLPLFTHPGALVKLAGWVREAVAVLEAEKGVKAKDGDGALVLGCLDEGRGVYVVVGLGGGGGGGGRAGGYRSKAEIKERAERKKRREVEKAMKAAEKIREKRRKRELRREIKEANGMEDESDSSSSETESEASSIGSDSGSESEDEAQRGGGKRNGGRGLNRFGQAFQEVVEATGARVRIDSFEHSVVEVRKEDLGGFLEGLSGRVVVG